MARRGIVVALIAAVSFGAGIAVSSTNSTAAVIAKIPLIGDGLDATPNPSADFTDFWKAWNTLEAKYVSTHASSTLPTIEERIFGAIQGLAASYGDPYTVYFPPEEAKQFEESISGSFGGVGMEIDVKNGILTVIAPLKGTPAETAGIKAGDQIISINTETTEGISVEKAVSKIRGPVGTTVELTLLREGTIVDVKVIRQKIEVPETDDSLDENNNTYRIELYEFSATSVSQFNQAFARFKASRSKMLILDLRGNPGGYLNAAVDIASHFLPKGAPIVTEDFAGKEENNVHQSRGYNDLPRGATVVALIDGGSASASEIVAGALQDHDVATVIGTKSFGKGSVQTLLDLGQGSLKVTVARWITPDGHFIMDNGITPDIVVPYTPEDAAAKKDPQLERAIKFLTTGK